MFVDIHHSFNYKRDSKFLKRKCPLNIFSRKSFNYFFFLNPNLLPEVICQYCTQKEKSMPSMSIQFKKLNTNADSNNFQSKIVLVVVLEEDIAGAKMKPLQCKKYLLQKHKFIPIPKKRCINLLK